MGLIDKFVNALHGVEEAPANYVLEPAKFFTRRGHVDHSAMMADHRPEDEVHASGYDKHPIFIDYIADEPKKIFPDSTSVFEDSYCQNICFLMKELYNAPYGDKLENLDENPYITQDRITWRSFAREILGYSYGDIEVRFNRETKEYEIVFSCTSGILVYGRRYTAYGFENQAEVMKFLVDLYEELRVASIEYDKRLSEAKEAALAEAV